MAIYEPKLPSWSSCEYSSMPSILSIEEEVVYPWEIDVAISCMSNVQECKLLKTKTTVKLKTVPELMAEGYSAGNSHYASDSLRQSVEVCSTSSSPSEWRGVAYSSSSHSLVSTTKRGRPQEAQSHEVDVEGACFAGAPEHSDPGDGPSSTFPTQK